MDTRREALASMRTMLAAFLDGRLSAADFIPAFGKLFAPFDPYPSNAGGLTDHERHEVETYIRVWGGWFGEHDDKVPKRPDWRYGVDLEPYGWIDEPGYRTYIDDELRRAGIGRSSSP